MEQSQTKRQHTTHLEGYPAEVTVVRARHPLEGQALLLLGWMRRHGKLDLILVLPDGSRTLIPAGWTDLDPSSTPREAASVATLGSIADLLHAGRVLAGIVQFDPARPDDGPISNLEDAHAQSAVGAGPRGDAGARTAPLGIACQPSTTLATGLERERGEELGRFLHTSCVVGQYAIEALGEDLTWAIRHIAEPPSAADSQAYGVAAPGQIKRAPKIAAVLTSTQLAVLRARDGLARRLGDQDQAPVVLHYDQHDLPML